MRGVRVEGLGVVCSGHDCLRKGREREDKREDKREDEREGEREAERKREKEGGEGGYRERESLCVSARR